MLQGTARHLPRDGSDPGEPGCGPALDATVAQPPPALHGGPALASCLTVSSDHASLVEGHYESEGPGIRGEHRGAGTASCPLPRPPWPPNHLGWAPLPGAASPRTRGTYMASPTPSPSSMYLRAPCPSPRALLMPRRVAGLPQRPAEKGRSSCELMGQPLRHSPLPTCGDLPSTWGPTGKPQGVLGESAPALSSGRRA